MKVILLEKARVLSLEDRPAPALGPGEVLVRVNACGICGSDVHYYMDGRCSDKVVTRPHILGHEFSATIEKVGSGVAGLNPGALVAVQPAVPCRRCNLCLTGRHNLCRNVRFAGSFPHEGAYQEYYVSPADFVWPTPPGFTAEDAALLEPLACAVHAADRGAVTLGDKVAVLGCGPIGLMTAVACRACGGRIVAMTEPVKARRDAASRIGAEQVFDPREPGVYEAVDSLELDVVLDCAGASDTLDQALRVVAPGGRVVVVGFSQNPVTVSTIRGIRKEVNLNFMLRFVQDFPRAIALFQRERDALRRLITHRVPFDVKALEAAYEMVSGLADGVVKVMINYPGGLQPVACSL